MDNQQDNGLTGMIDRIICGFSDRMVLDMGIDEDDHRLERICDDMRAELTNALETLACENAELRDGIKERDAFASRVPFNDEPEDIAG